MSIVASYAISPLQQGMLFHHLMAPQAGVDLQQIVISGGDRLDTDRLREAWQQTADRHPILRTAFRWEGLDLPLQEVHDSALVPLVPYAWEGADPAAREARFAKFLDEDRRRGFDLRQPPLMRLTLFGGDGDAWRLVWTFHHILLDGRSSRLVLQEVFDLQDAALRGESPQRPLPRPYEEYIRWIQRLDRHGAREYWMERLRGFTAPTSIPVTRTAASGDGRLPGQGHATIGLDPATTERLRELARAHELTLNTLVQGAWAILLARYSGDPEVTFGVVRAGRRGTVEGADAMIGLFVNTLPLRIATEPDTRLLPWLKEIRSQWRSMRDHEWTVPAELQQWLGLPAGVPVFHSILMFEEYLLEHWMQARGGPWASRRIAIHGNAGFAVTVKAYDGPALTLQLEYDRTRLDPEPARRMAGHLRTILENLLEGLDRPLRAVRMVSGEEWRQLVSGWNGSTAPYPTDRTLPQIFEEQAARTPEAVAVIAGADRLTYGALNGWANLVAARLRPLGVGPDRCVAVCLERSPAMMAAVLAILKAGGAYVPLDPSYPADRLAYMLQNAQVAAVLTSPSLQASLPPSDVPVLLLENSTPAAGDGEKDADPGNPASTARPGNLAYVIYTSGSTGQPKGVAMPHEALVNLLHWQAARSRVGAGGRTLQFASLSFDVSFQEMFATWCVGGSLVLITEALRRDMPALLRWIRDQQVQRVFLPFIALQQMSEVAEEEGIIPDTLCEIVTAGEQLQVTRQLVRFFERLGDCRLDNQYGPTECHVVTACQLSGRPSEWPALPPIGRPIPNTRAYILDGDRRPVPVGVAGELYLAGVCLAREYLHRPELTAERFVTDPFVEGDARMYKTGDLARFTETGEIEYLGRQDTQVKVRGYRIELGEIETALAAHPAIRECAVVAREGPGGGLQLVSYFVAKPGSPAPAAGELRAYLARSLPDYMVPAIQVPLPALPLTPSGKIDRRSLPAPPAEAPAPPSEAERPRDMVEMQLVLIWERLLNRRGIGTRDNFFDLGGHSLLAVRMLAQVRRVFEVDLPLVVLFEAPTLDQLATRIRAGAGSTGWFTLVALQPAGSKPPLFCVPGGGSILLAYRDLVANLPPDQPVYGFQSPCLAGERPPFGSIEEQAAAYVQCLRQAQAEGPYHLLGWCIGGLIAFEMAQQLRAAGQEVALLVLADTKFPRATPPALHEQIGYRWRMARTLPLGEALRYLGRETRQFVVSRGRRSTGSPPPASPRATDDEETRRRLDLEDQVLHAEVAAGRKYRPRPFAGRLTLFWPTEKPMEAYVNSPAEWTRMAAGGAEHHRLEGSHHSMFLEPLVRGLAKTLAGCLEAARASRSN